MSADRLVSGWNARSGAEVAAAFTEDGRRIEFAKPGADIVGRDALAAHTQGYITAVPDCVLDVRGTTVAGDVTVLEWTYRGTHTGDIPGLEATGRDIDLPGVSVLKMDGDLVAEERVYWDAATLFGLMED
jgi:predicted ester cyclase